MASKDTRRAIAIALGGLLGAGQEASRIGERKQKRRDRAELMYESLVANPKLRLIENAPEFKPGMTVVQVRALFETDPDAASTSRQFAFDDTPLPAEQLPFYQATFDEFKDQTVITGRMIATAQEKQKSGVRLDIALMKNEIQQKKFSEGVLRRLINLGTAGVQLLEKESPEIAKKYLDLVGANIDTIQDPSVKDWASRAWKEKTLSPVGGFIGAKVEFNAEDQEIDEFLKDPKNKQSFLNVIRKRKATTEVGRQQIAAPSADQGALGQDLSQPAGSPITGPQGALTGNVPGVGDSVSSFLPNVKNKADSLKAILMAINSNRLQPGKLDLNTRQGVGG